MENKNIVVVDSIMGTGKSSWAFQEINAHPEQSIIYCTPFLKEIERINEECNRHFYDPQQINGRKLDGFNHLLMDGKDIAVAELYSENFDAIQSDYDSRLSQYEHLANSYDSDIDMLEAKGYLAETTYYEGLNDVERQRIAMLKDELSSLKKSFSDAMASGEIEEGSETWYDMKDAIAEVEESIDDANLSLQEYTQTIREIKWDNFDYGIERISRLITESEFLIDLMSSKDMFDDNSF